MADILNYDVRTYVLGLMKKELSSKDKEEIVPSENRKTDTGEHRKVPPPSAAISRDGKTDSDLRE